MLSHIEVEGGAVALQKTCSLLFVMKEMGNGVIRLMTADLLPLDTRILPILSAGALLADPLPGHIDDIARVAMRSLGADVAGWAIEAPAHGFARYLDEGLTEVIIRLALLL